MYSDWPVLAGVVVTAVFVWLGSLSFLVWRQNKFLKALFPKSGERDIRKKFEELVKAVEGFDGKLTDLNGQVTEVNTQGMRHVQRVELVRFNPFNETGGDQSFTVCLLDNQGSGLVLTSLHARSGTRVFAKPVVRGKSSRYELSKEEEAVIKKAMEEKSHEENS